MHKYFAVLIGFGTFFATRIFDDSNLHLNDVVAVILACLAGLALINSISRNRTIHVAYVAIGLLTIGWIGAEVHYSSYLPQQSPAAMILVRWIVAIPAGLYLAILCKNDVFRRYLFLGAIVGCLMSTIILLVDFSAYQTTKTQIFGSDDPGIPTWVNGEYRAVGIFGHPNGAAIACQFVVPLIIGAAEEFDWRRWVLIVSLPVVCSVFYVTQTRSAMIGAVLLLLLWGLQRRPAFVFAALSSLTVLVTVVFLYNSSVNVPNFNDRDLLSELIARFSDQSALEYNASGRMETTLTSLELAFQHPFGMGSTYEAPLDRATGFTATHNGLAQLGLLGGMPLACLIAFLLMRTAFGLLSHRRMTYHWLAAYLLIVSMFESVFYLPFFSTVMLWVVASSLLGQPTAAVAALATAGGKQVPRAI